MSDNLSEEEISALLTPESDRLTPLLEDFVRINQRMNSLYASALGGLVNQKCAIGNPQVLLTSPNDVLERLSDEVVNVQVPLRGLYSGLHSYFLDPKEATNIAGPIMGMEVEELDDTGISALSEAFSRVTSAQLAFIEREFDEKISAGSPDIRRIPKDTLVLTPPVFTLQYDISLEGTKALTVVEVLNQDLAESIGKLLNNDDVTSVEKRSDVPKVEGVDFPSFRIAEIGPQEEQNLGLLMDVPVSLAVELGRTKWQLRDVLTIGEGSIIELEKQAGEPVDVLVNNNLIARGEVVVVDENFSVRITEIITSFEQMVQKGL